jgi:type II secretory pathway component GspD/PulD (secretin)
MMSRSISYREVGTSVQVVPEISADGLVGLELRVEDARMRPAESVALATDDRGANVPATEFVISTLESKLRVRPGYVVLAQGTMTTSKSGQVQTVVLVSAVPAEAGQ